MERNYTYIRDEKIIESEHGRLRCVVAGEEDGGQYANPRDNDNLGTMVTWGRITNHYSIGEEQLGEYPSFAIECAKCEGYGTSDKWQVRHYDTGVLAQFERESEADEFYSKLLDTIGFTVEQVECPECEGTGEAEVDPETYFRATENAVVVLPLNIRDYGSHGLIVSIGHDWEDADGCIYTTPDALLRRWGKWNGELGEASRYDDPNELDGPEIVDWYAVFKIAEDGLRSEVKEYDEWGRGEVYYFDVTDADTGESVEDGTCGAYIGEDGAEYAMSEAVSVAEGELEARAKEAAEVAYWAARDVETVA